MKWFLLINLAFVILLFWLYRRDVKQGRPSKLNFSKNKRTLDSDSFQDILNQKNQNNDQYEKVLNILFQYNGETWDAYEVLGLPAGSHGQAAQVAYEISVREGRDKEPFLRAARDAIIANKK